MEVEDERWRYERRGDERWEIKEEKKDENER
jgi:hypothetical protein